MFGRTAGISVCGASLLLLASCGTPHAPITARVRATPIQSNHGVGFIVVARENVQSVEGEVHVVSSSPLAVLAFSGLKPTLEESERSTDQTQTFRLVPIAGSDVRVELKASPNADSPEQLSLNQLDLNLSRGDFIRLKLGDGDGLEILEQSSLPDSFYEPVFLQLSVAGLARWAISDRSAR